MRKAHNVKDMTGMTINGLKVIKRNGSKRKLAVWQCECRCGKLFDAVGSDLRTGKTKTCGCRISIESKRNWQGYEHISKTYWQSVVHNAEQRSLEFSITIEYAWKLWILQAGRCSLSGLLLTIGRDKKRYTGSLDRIDNSKGYVKGNVQWVHKTINKMKSSLGKDEFIWFCNQVAKECPLKI